jgi:hypothetical protein
MIRGTKKAMKGLMNYLLPMCITYRPANTGDERLPNVAGAQFIAASSMLSRTPKPFSNWNR